MAFSPFMMVDVTAKFGGTSGTDYAEQVSQVQFDPSPTTANWKGLKAASVFTFMGQSTWTCTLALAQDWKNTTSLSNYLLQNEGKPVPIEFRPNGGTTTPITATVVATPGTIGGTVDAVATATVTLGVVGKPAIGTAA